METTVKSRLEELLGGVLAPAPLQALMVLLGNLSQLPVGSLRPDEAGRCLERVNLALRVYCPNPGLADLTRRRVTAALGAEPAAGPTPAGSGRPPAAPAHPPAHSARPAQPAGLAQRGAATRESSVPVTNFDDAVRARMSAKDLATHLGFSESISVRIATAVSELARNIVFYAGQGSVRLSPCAPPASPRPGLRIVASDAGPGIPNLDEILAGRYRSQRGMGLGLKGVKQLMDEFAVETGAGRGTVVRVAKWL